MSTPLSEVMGQLIIPQRPEQFYFSSYIERVERCVLQNKVLVCLQLQPPPGLNNDVPVHLSNFLIHFTYMKADLSLHIVPFLAAFLLSPEIRPDNLEIALDNGNQAIVL